MDPYVSMVEQCVKRSKSSTPRREAKKSKKGS